MKVLPGFLIVCIVCAICSSCERAQLRREMKEMMTSEVILPKHLEVIYGGESTEIESSELLKPMLIIFIDSTGCSTCRISRFIRYQNIYETADSSKNFSLLLLLSPKKAEMESIKEYLMMDDKYPIPVYLDTDNAFRRLNDKIPDDTRFHSFLVDAYGKPVLIGDPTSNERLMKLFSSKIYN